MSVARASRNSILQSFRVWRLAELQKTQKRSKVVKRMKFMNARALAIMRNPSLFPRGRGRLHWQPAIPRQQRRQLTHRGQPEALQAYCETNAESLRMEAQVLRNDAKRGPLVGSNELPVSNKEWLQWLDKHHDLFNQTMKVATETRQKEYSKRLEPVPGLIGLSRLRPRARSLPPWAQKIKGVTCLISLLGGSMRNGLKGI